MCLRLFVLLALMRRSYSPQASPSRKRRRMNFSSPNIDDDFPLPSQEELEVFDRVDQSQNASTISTKAAGKRPERGSSGSPLEEPANLPADHDNPFAPASSTSAMLGFSAASALGFSTASSLKELLLKDTRERSPSPEHPPEQDHSSWFAPMEESFIGYQSASFTTASAFVAPSASQDAPNPDVSFGFQTASSRIPPEMGLGFKSASARILAPSAEALAKARKKIESWEKEEGQENAGLTEDSISPPKPVSTPLPPASPSRTVLQSLSIQAPSTPAPTISRASRLSTPSGPIPSPSLRSGPRPKPFKSPLIVPKTRNASTLIQTSSPLNPQSSRPMNFSSARSQHPLSASPITTASPLSNSQYKVPATPIRTPLQTPVHSSTPRFRTPFKAGMEPGNPGRSKLEEQLKAAVPIILKTPGKPTQSSKQQDTNKHRCVFDLTQHSSRQQLSSSNLTPQQYTREELEAFGLAAAELAMISPSTAYYYKFYEPGIDAESPSKPLGTLEAFQELLKQGCTDVTQEWVDNHWNLILWKLAGMAALDPEKESRVQEKKWSWKEVLSQLLYRYEREINCGIRPPLRRIVTKDSQAASPMVVCISGISWPPATGEEAAEPLPELEITDGWYRLRASVDKALSRAVKRGILKVGRKIAIAGASLWSENKDPQEILEAFDSTRLVLGGNGSHLVPWHTKLGFLPSCPIATMHSLTSDGGVVPFMDLVILQVFPMLYMEMRVRDGKLVNEGSRSKKEEFAERDRWTRLRENEEAKLREAHSKTYSRYQGYAQRLQQKAGSNFTRGDDGPPDSVYDYYEQLEEPEDAANVFKMISAREAGWLAWYIQESQEREQDKIRDEIERELDDKFPPRQVHTVLTLLAQDSETSRYPANRLAQLTIWDATKYAVVEGKPGHFEEGFRLQITRLYPTHPSAWMGHEPNSQILLCTKSSSTIQKIK